MEVYEPTGTLPPLWAIFWAQLGVKIKFELHKLENFNMKKPNWTP